MPPALPLGTPCRTAFPEKGELLVEFPLSVRGAECVSALSRLLTLPAGLPSLTCTTAWFWSHAILPAGSRHTSLLQTSLALHFSGPWVPRSLISPCRTPLGGWTADSTTCLEAFPRPRRQSSCLLSPYRRSLGRFVWGCVPVPLLLGAGISPKMGTCFVMCPGPAPCLALGRPSGRFLAEWLSLSSSVEQPVLHPPGSPRQEGKASQAHAPSAPLLPQAPVFGENCLESRDASVAASVTSVPSPRERSNLGRANRVKTPVRLATACAGWGTRAAPHRYPHRLETLGTV